MYFELHEIHNYTSRLMFRKQYTDFTITSMKLLFQIVLESIPQFKNNLKINIISTVT